MQDVPAPTDCVAKAIVEAEAIATAFAMLAVPADVDYCAFSTGDLTVSVRIKRMGDGDNDEEYILSNYDGGGTNSWAIIYSRSGKTIMFYNFTTSNGCRFSVDLSADTNWHIIEFCRSGTSWYPFFDGILKTPNYDTIAGESVGDSTKRLSSGCLDPAVPARFWNGFIDEIHISKGVARHTSGYTVPTAEYLNTSIKNVSGVAYSSIKKISNIAIASVKKCSGVA